MSARSVYIHVPFCAHRCGYCDFTVLAGHDDLMADWLQALENELGHWATPPVPVDTIFVGGGTPTRLSGDLLTRLLDSVTRSFPLAAAGEFSVEANPEDLDAAMLTRLADTGVNRISLGVQSFDDAALKVLERGHSARSAAETVERTARVIPNVSVDLMFAVPGQSFTEWQSTLQTALALPITHLSTYGLTWEQGTKFTARAAAGDLQNVSDTVEREMYLHAIAAATAEGFEHYEVSNFARPGFRSRHNLVYWRAEEYHACGPGAARYLNGIRSTNSRNVRRWIRSWAAHQPCPGESEQLTSEERAREALMLGLRLRDGLLISEFEHRFDVNLRDLAGPVLDRGRRTGLLTDEGGRLRLTMDGLLIADSVIADLL